MIILYSDFGDGYKGKSVVGTINGNNMSIDTHQDLAHASGQISYMTATYLPNVQKLVISYQYNDGNDYGYARVGTVNGSNNTIAYRTLMQLSLLLEEFFTQQQYIMLHLSKVVFGFCCWI